MGTSLLRWWSHRLPVNALVFCSKDHSGTTHGSSLGIGALDISLSLGTGLSWRDLSRVPERWSWETKPSSTVILDAVAAESHANNWADPDVDKPSEGTGSPAVEIYSGLTHRWHRNTEAPRTVEAHLSEPTISSSLLTLKQSTVPLHVPPPPAPPPPAPTPQLLLPPPPATMTQQTPTLTASYTSPTNPPFTHTASLPALPAPASPQTTTTQTPPTPAAAAATAQKKAYLAALRQATLQMQQEVNRELTARMEEDSIDSEKRGVEGKEGGGW
ncbi:hypothetical protein MBM_08972 [Drepanopeziza brunnea f. sp. 'multigermtubi' MB_m1]|uniref:EKC/KEOPS complex subunit GON7 n=1 Tax=Marssonina brunnea f. sp. multigermtubi (strain MB_m1) TaxID=1072389 RepID=K1WVP5_MARBU|nr:uncharacterized protein MBM_08972 [Drepanopeziza brunnea f. sp. 'multigermtubi' MB_m1]EKD12743.1 hypothetical protein MBM_08972 [Drepanopeziza brunnea f. sp. 'multigermtubi' MB_m1]